MINQQIEQSLATSFEDYRLDSDEKYSLKATLSLLKDDPTKLSFARNRAFQHVATHYRSEQPNHQAALKWLENVVKTIDSVRKNEPVSQSAYFSPGSTCQSKIIALIKNAKSQIKICVFTISDDKISEAILAAFKRGIDVKVVTDNDKANDLGSDIYRLSDRGVSIKIDQSPSHMHHKFAIVDNRQLINGSFNWTRSASKYNQENVTVGNDQKLIKHFDRIFDDLWQACVAI